MRSPIDALLSRLAVLVAPRVREQLINELHTALQSEFSRERLINELRAAFQADLRGKPLLSSELYLPNPLVTDGLADEYMAASVPLARDFLHPKFAEFARTCGTSMRLHRKTWEWAFINERLQRAGVLCAGRRGVGFGVGNEWLPALFASTGATIVATDHPSDTGNWRDSGQYAGNLDGLFAPHIIDRAAFDARVSFSPCDMNAIPEDLNGFDFCWSSCCFEHLGDLQRGLDFVLSSVERVLAVGGVACHTTELNLSSDDDTIESGRDVIYRKRDLLQLCQELTARGHSVEPLCIEPGNLVLDYLVDVPPYDSIPHLKLRYEQFVCTSIGLVIRRGR
jgi:SAM-dependent methyltransferase